MHDMVASLDKVYCFSKLALKLFTSRAYFILSSAREDIPRHVGPVAHPKRR